MKLFACTSFLTFLFLVQFSGTGEAEFTKDHESKPLAHTPPRGWNSYDSFSWVISEEEFLENAEFVAANLSKHGYEYVVVDFLWYRRLEPGSSVWSGGHDIIDQYGRLLPDPWRWPSTRNGNGFKPIADKVHAMGLKFGIHVMRGISTQAVKSNAKICNVTASQIGGEECYWTAKDIALKGTECSWMTACFMSVNTTSEGGLLFLNSLYKQYAEWGVDFIKHDCVFGENDMSVSEITAVSEAIERTGRQMIYSLSPGVRATPRMAKQVAHLSHMYRVTSDDWDLWWDVLLHFSVARDFAAAGLLGGPGLQGGRSWPDLDMLPIGWLTDPGAPYGPYRPSSLTKPEQLTQVTLWSIAKSPLIFGGDLRHIDRWTLDLITHPTVLEINAHSSHNQELRRSSVGSLPVVKLEDCVSAITTEWKLQRATDDLMQVCWSDSSKLKYPKSRQQAVLTSCLNWARTPWIHNDLYSNAGSERGFLWSEMVKKRLCLDLVGSMRIETKGSAEFEMCNNAASQVWRLTSKGRLVSEQNGHCVTIVQPERGWRIWVARGVSDEGYVAFFNLEEKRQNISVSVEEVLLSLELLPLRNSLLHQVTRLIERLYNKLLQQCNMICHHIARKMNVHQYLGTRARLETSEWTCRGMDVWKGTTLLGDSLSGAIIASVEGHGTTLIRLTCIYKSRHTLASVSILTVVGILCSIAGVTWVVDQKRSGGHVNNLTRAYGRKG